MAKKLTTTKSPEKKNITGGLTGSELTKTNKVLKEQIQDLKDQAPEWWKPETIVIRSPFKDLFPIKEETLHDISENMSVHGFDKNQPLILGVFPEGFALVDGHTRREASINIQLENIPVIKIEFDNDQEALDYAIHLQKDRRNITDSELYTYIHALDKVKKTGRKELGLTDPNSLKGRSADHTAKLTGTSATKVKKARTIEKTGSNKLKDEVKAGKKTINAAYREIKDKDANDKYLPKVTVSCEQILFILKKFENLLDSEESKLHINCGKILGIYDLISLVIPKKMLMGEKYKSIGIPLLAAYTKIEDKIDIGITLQDETE